MCHSIAREDSVFERAIEEEGRDVQRRLFAHHDYFGNVIPSSWFVVGCAVGMFVFYRPELAVAVLSLKSFLRPLGEPSTGVDVVIAVVLAVATFNLIYILGQLLNGVAAVVLDRVIVKKLLKYPFTLYELKWLNRDTNKADTLILREAMLDATYGVFCVNLVPPVFFELALVAFGRENPYPGSWVQLHPLSTIALSVVLVVTHVGLPSLRKAKESCEGSAAAKTMYLELFYGHIIAIVVVATAIGAAIAFGGYTWVVLILPVANIVVAACDRHMLTKYGPKYTSDGMRRVFLYLRRSFLNPSYFAAKLVGYSASPDATLIGKAFSEARYDSRANDFYWMCQLRLENDAPRSYDTAYHGMAMYTMNRNLCNSTAFVAVAAFYIRWPEGARYSALVWVATLCAFTYMFFIRYLYLFSGLYSKYVVRAAAFLVDRSKHILVPAEGA